MGGLKGRGGGNRGGGWKLVQYLSFCEFHEKERQIEKTISMRVKDMRDIRRRQINQHCTDNLLIVLSRRKQLYII